MASKQRKATHLIPNSLTHSGGTITAVFDSGARQVVLSGLTASTVYYLYLRTVSNTPTLFFVTTVPSTYRVSFPDAILVGAFLSNGSVSPAFGGFINIEGEPATEQFAFTPTGNFNTSMTYSGMMSRRADKLFCRVHMTFGASQGAVDHIANLPSGLTMPAAKLIGQSATITTIFGRGQAFDGGTQVALFTVSWRSANTLGFGYQQQSTVAANNLGGTVPFTFGAGSQWSYDYEVPITGWTAHPLKDL